MGQQMKKLQGPNKGPINRGSKGDPLQNLFWWLQEGREGPPERWR